MSGFITRRNAAKVAIAAWAGAAMLGYENANAKRAIDDAKPLANYSALRAYAGRASGVRITSAGIAGHFRRDVTDTTSSDNGGTIIVDARGDRWKRQVIGSWDAAWFGFSSARTSAENALALSALTAAAEIAKASVVVAKGTYLLPPQTSLKANDTEWHFEPGAVLKLHDTQATTSFLSFPAPVRQRVYGLTVDGNRAAQNATSFGADNSALIVVDARNCLFDSTKIISSPAKGFVLVSTKGGNTRDTTIREFVGNNCVAQVLLIDGNNRTGSFERIIVDGVQIGATSHGGLVVNDGAHDIAISNVNADVHNTTWDAVSIRDSHDLKLTNIHGKRGRNGVYLQRLNGLCGRIQMHNVTGEFSEQNGILFLGAEDVTGNKVGGRNNGSAGINIAAGAGGYRSRNIRITCAFGYDDQGVKTQKYGILVQAADNVTLENARVHDNISRNVSIVKAGTAHVDVELRQAVIASSGATKIEVEHASCE